MNKVPNNKAWWLVLPMFLLVAFSAIIPLMTVVNYSLQDIFDQNTAYFVGVEWYQEVLLISGLIIEADMDLLAVKITDQSLVESLNLIKCANVLNQLLRIFRPRSTIVVNHVYFVELFCHVQL